MPSRVKSHFPPSTSRTQFSPERVLDFPSFAYKMHFPPEGPLLTETTSASPPPDIVTPPTVSEMILSDPPPGRSPSSKPKGEFNRPSNGYSLIPYCTDTLRWDHKKLASIQVSSDHDNHVLPIADHTEGFYRIFGGQSFESPATTNSTGFG